MKPQLPKHLKPGTKVERFLKIDAEREIDIDARTVTLAFASETPVERYWGIEVLSVSAQSMRSGRLKQGAALLMDHDSRDQVGVIETVQIGKDKVARAVVRFGNGARASEIFRDVVDGIRQNVSVAYRIHDAVLEEEHDGVGTYRLTDWEPYEVSIVSIPADSSVGVGRSDDSENQLSTQPHQVTRMDHENENTPAAPAAPAIDTRKLAADAQRTGVEAERKRVADITAAADALKEYPSVRNIAAEAIRAGWSMDEFRAKSLESVTTPPLPGANVGMSRQEIRRYSVLRVLHALANPMDMQARNAAAFEFEASEAAAEKQGRSIKGVLVPYDVLAARADDDLVGTATKGGNTVATDLLTANFIDLLRNKMVLSTLGAQYLSGLVGNIAIPRQTGGATFYMVAESGSPTASGQTFDQVTMSPKTGGARTQISRKLLKQSSLDIEAFVRNDLATCIGLGMQGVAIKGGGSNEPTGILSTTGIGSVAGGTNGAAPDWADIIALETSVAGNDADIGTLGYLTNAKVRGKLKGTEKFSGSNGQPVWVDGNTPLNGYRAFVTNAVASNGTKGTGSNLSTILFGNFADMIIGLWGGLELQVDPYSSGDSGSVVVRAFQDFDIGIRHKESFAAMTDAITA